MRVTTDCSKEHMVVANFGNYTIEYQHDSIQNLTKDIYLDFFRISSDECPILSYDIKSWFIDKDAEGNFTFNITKLKEFPIES